MKKFAVITVCVLFANIVFAQWEWQNPTPHGHALSDVQMLNEDIVISVGDYGTKFSMCIDIGNSGLIGMPMKVFFTETIAFEFFYW